MAPPFARAPVDRISLLAGREGKSSASGGARLFRRMPPISDPEAVTVEKLGRVTDDFVEAWARLIPQLSGAPAPARERLEWVVGHEANTVLVARDADGTIIGTTTL